MWGATPLDQLWCRLQFRKARYEGDFTPPGVKEAIFYPGSAGGSNWGSVTIDGPRGLMIANSLYMADIGRLIPRAEADRMAAEYAESGSAESFAFPQKGTPYAMDRKVFMGPLGVPCQQPPFGRLSAIDLDTGKLVWSQPLGDASAAGPFGLASHLPIRMGMPNFGGSLATAGGGDLHRRGAGPQAARFRHRQWQGAVVLPPAGDRGGDADELPLEKRAPVRRHRGGRPSGAAGAVG